MRSTRRGNFVGYPIRVKQTFDPACEMTVLLGTHLLRSERMVALQQKLRNEGLIWYTDGGWGQAEAIDDGSDEQEDRCKFLIDWLIFAYFSLSMCSRYRSIEMEY